MYVHDTIAAVSTPVGRGAIGIVRLSGREAAAIARAVCGRDVTPRHAHYTALRSRDGTVIDRGIVLHFPAPASYTGEDLFEFQLHASPPLLRELLATLLALGARAARPGEFTERAFLNDRLDLLQAEAVAALIDAGSLRAARAAREACDGAFSEAVATITDEIRLLRVRLEALIDFGDDVPSDGTEAAVIDKLEVLATSVARVRADASRGARLAKGLDIAIVGRPNSGKSTLLNALCGEERAIVTDIPGTTRDVLSVDVELDGIAVRLHDTAGLRDTEDSVEREGVSRARQRLSRCDLALHLVAPDVEDARLDDELASSSLAVLRIGTKLDLGKPARPVDVAISAHTGAGLDELRAAIVRNSGVLDTTDAPYLARERHLRALALVADSVAAAQLEIGHGQFEIAAEELARAQRALGELTGTYTTEDLLGDIFSSFCIGK